MCVCAGVRVNTSLARACVFLRMCVSATHYSQRRHIIQAHKPFIDVSNAYVVLEALAPTPAVNILPAARKSTRPSWAVTRHSRARLLLWYTSLHSSTLIQTHPFTYPHIYLLIHTSVTHTRPSLCPKKYAPFIVAHPPHARTHPHGITQNTCTLIRVCLLSIIFSVWRNRACYRHVRSLR